MSDESNVKEKPKKRKFSKLKYIIAFIFINVIIFFVVTSQPRFELSIVQEANSKSVEIRVTQKSFFPLRSFNMYLDDAPLSYSKSGNVYVATAEKNGTLEVVATNMNTMTQTIYERIDSIDATAPTIFAQLVKKGVLNITFEDNQSTIDFDSIYAIDSKDKRLAPIEVNEEEHRATFEFKTDSIKAFVSDVVGNEAEVEFNNSEINQTKLVSSEGVETNDIPVEEIESSQGNDEETTFDVGNLNEKPPKKNDDYLYEKH
mgnify:CR=1 FL=1